MSSEERLGLTALLAAIQYADAAYPSGGFSHSWGLEAAVAAGDVRTASQLAGALTVLLQAQVGSTDAVAAAACCRLGADFGAFVRVDERLSAARTTREARLASLRMGRRLAETAAQAEDDAWLGELWQRIRDRATPGNHAPVLGAIAAGVGLSPAQAAALALWTALNGALAAAMRLLPITHDDLQTIAVALRPLLAQVAASAAGADPARMAGSAPQFDLWSMEHERAEVRLFSS